MNKRLFVALSMAMLAAQDFPPGLLGADLPNHRSRDPHEGETPEERRRRLKRLYGSKEQLHEYIIHGERIMADSKVAARKIYAKRHPEAKKKGKK